MRVSKAWAIILVALLNSAMAGEPWTMTTVQGERHAIEKSEFSFPQDAPPVGGEKGGSIGWGDVDAIKIGDRAIGVPTGQWVVKTRGGGVLTGELVGGDAKSLRLIHIVLGELTIPVQVVASIQRRGETHSPGSMNDEEDVLRLTSGDFARGAVSQFSTDGVALFDGESDREFEWANVQSIQLAATSKKATDEVRALLHLTDGTVIVTDSFHVRGGKLEIEKGEGRGVKESVVTVPVARVRRIEIVGGRRTWLGMLPPSHYEATPYMDIRWPYRVDRCVTGGPLALRGKIFDRGIGLHSACRITWNLEGRFERFTGMVGVDDSAGTLADVGVRVIVDGRVLGGWEHMKLADAPHDVDVSVSGAKQLIIEVGFGANGDTQDRVDVVNAALIAK